MLHRIPRWFLAGAILFVPSVGLCFEQPAHVALTLHLASRMEAELQSKLAQIELGSFSEARRSMADGSNGEDEPLLRPQHHFHNPIGDEGLGFPFFGTSAVRWAQVNGITELPLPADPNSSHSSDSVYPDGFGWYQAREFLRIAILDGDAVAFQQAFHNLGRTLHLLQDAGSPAHVRNDAHLPGDVEPDHRWVDPNLVCEILGAADSVPIPLFGDLVGLAPSIQAAIPVVSSPISNLFDTQFYDGTTCPSFADALAYGGLSEITAASFFSKESIGRFDCPPSHVVLANCDLEGKRQCEYQGNIVARVGEHNRLTVDDFEVIKEQAKVLLPLVTGYGISLVRYFLRGVGLLELKVVDGRLELHTRGDETLVGGTVQLLYLDDEGNRIRLSDEQAVGAIAPASPVELSIPLNALLDSAGKRVLAVYSGPIGSDPQGLATSEWQPLESLCVGDIFATGAPIAAVLVKAITRTGISQQTLFLDIVDPSDASVRAQRSHSGGTSEESYSQDRYSVSHIGPYQRGAFQFQLERFDPEHNHVRRMMFLLKAGSTCVALDKAELLSRFASPSDNLPLADVEVVEDGPGLVFHVTRRGPEAEIVLDAPAPLSDELSFYFMCEEGGAGSVSSYGHHGANVSYGSPAGTTAWGYLRSFVESGRIVDPRGRFPGGTDGIFLAGGDCEVFDPNHFPFGYFKHWSVRIEMSESAGLRLPEYENLSPVRRSRPTLSVGWRYLARIEIKYQELVLDIFGEPIAEKQWASGNGGDFFVSTSGDRASVSFYRVPMFVDPEKPQNAAAGTFLLDARVLATDVLDYVIEIEP